MSDILGEMGTPVSRVIFENSYDGILLGTLDGAILAANPVACHILGQTQHEIVESGWYSLFKAAKPDFDDLLKELKGGGSFRGEIYLLLPGGSTYPVEVSCTTYRDRDGHEAIALFLRDISKRGQTGADPDAQAGIDRHDASAYSVPGYHLTVSQDITERTTTEGNLRGHATSRSPLLKELRNEEEAERRRLATDIHDGPLQSIGVALLSVERVLRRWDQGERKLAKLEMQNLRGILTESVAQLRSVLADLSEEILVQYGLPVAVQSYAERFIAVTGIRVEVISSLDRRLPADIELLMYQLAQEALSNVRKHSHAKNASVSIEERDNRLLMKISDDGIGFNVAEAWQGYEAGKQLGLRSMQRRVQAVGGDLGISSEPGAGKGTLVMLSHPL